MQRMRWFLIIFLAFVFFAGYSFWLLHNRQLVCLEQRVADRLIEIEKTTQGRPETKVVETMVSKYQPWGLLQKKVHDTVCRVSVFHTEFDWLQPFKTPRQKEGSGSGFFINEEGDFITNAHVVDQAYAIGIQIPSCGLEIFDAEVRGIAFDRDFALVRLSEHSKERIREILGKIPYLKLGDSDVVRRTDEVMALGYPLGQEGLKSTIGVVSGKEWDKIQIDAAINPGSSGGPVLNINGGVVGVACSGVIGAQNIGYIIPVNTLQLILDDLSKNRLLRRPFLGVFFSPCATQELIEYLGNPAPGGCYVIDVYKGSPMHKAGIKAGDMIYQMNGYLVDSYGHMQVPWSEDRISVIDYGGRLKVGEKISMIIYRNGERKELSADFDFGALPPIRTLYPGYEDIDYEIIGGMVVMPLTINHVAILASEMHSLIKYSPVDIRNLLEPVLIITHIFPGSQARRSRVLAKGMELKEVNGMSVKTLEEFRKAVHKSANSKFLTIKTSQDQFAAIKLDALLADEPRLSRDYRYPVTALVRDLFKQTKGGDISSAIYQMG